MSCVLLHLTPDTLEAKWQHRIGDSDQVGEAYASSETTTHGFPVPRKTTYARDYRQVRQETGNQGTSLPQWRPLQILLPTILAKVNTARSTCLNVNIFLPSTCRSHINKNGSEQIHTGRCTNTDLQNSVFSNTSTQRSYTQPPACTRSVTHMHTCSDF